MSDALHRFLFEALDIRGALVQLDASWRDMQGRRGYPDPVRDLLGELAAVTTLIAGNLKSRQRMSFQLQGHGAVSLLVMDCQPHQHGPLDLRGVARGDWTHDDIAAHAALPVLLGDGKLVLTLHQPDAQAYQSVVPLDGARVAAVFEHYLEQSEQQPAFLSLTADHQRACGLFLQPLPGAADKDADGWNRIAHLASTVKPEELALAPAELVGRLFAGEAVRLFEPRPVRWHCPRDEAKVRAMLATLGRDEVAAMLGDTGVIEIDDEICGHHYRFDAAILDELFPPEAQPKRTLH